MVIGIDINIGYASGYAVYIYMQKTIRFLRYAAGYALHIYIYMRAEHLQTNTMSGQ